MELRQLTIIGAGGHGRVVADIADGLGYGHIRFVDERWPKLQSNMIWPVVSDDIGTLEPQCEVFVAVGDCSKRSEIVKSLLDDGRTLPTLKHGSAQVSQHSSVGVGSVIMPLVCVNACSKLGTGVIANTACSIDHDCVLENGVHVSPGAILAGGVKVGANSWIGAGAVIREGVIIGRNCIVAAGAVVISDVPDGTCVAGVPARVLKKSVLAT
jgi:sugar O-acyltransferase (sialic acid O-acetyltransferase NeuD family)